MIQGRVIDTETRAPVAGVSVVLTGTSLGALTNAGGRYVVPIVPPGVYELTAAMMGYEADTDSAQVQAGQTAVVDFELRQQPIEMQGIVVTGTRTPHYVKDAPVRTEVITSQRIEEKAAPDLYGALQGLPGIRIEQRCSACNYSTVRMQGLESGHTQVLIDGQPVYSDLAAVYGLQQVPTNNIERIEVVKGAGSALYGSSAIAGVINIITKSATDEPRVDVSSSFGTAGTNAYSMIASRSFGDVGAVLNAQKNTGDGIDENGDGLTDRVESDNLALGVHLDWDQVLGNDHLTVHGRTLDEDRRGGDLATWDNAFAASAEHIQTNRYEAGLRYTKTFANAVAVTLDVSHASHGRTATNDAFRSDYEAVHGSPPGLDEMAPYRADEDTWVVDANASRPVGGMHHVLGGFQYTYNELNETGKYMSVDPANPGYGRPYMSRARKHAVGMAAFVQDEWHLTGAAELVLGARYDLHSSGDEFGEVGEVASGEGLELQYDEHAFSPRLALRLTATENLVLRGSVGTGFRVPYGFSEEMHLCSGSPRVYKPLELRPEKSISFNVSGEYRSQRLVVDANLFRTNLRNKIGFTSAGEHAQRLGYTYEWQNIAEAYTQGLELGIQTAVGKDLTLDLSGAYIDARYSQARPDWLEAHPDYAEDSKYLPRTPLTTAGLGVTYTPGPWNLNVSANYTGPMYVDYYQDDDVWSPGSKIVRTPSFVVTDCKFSRDVWGVFMLFGGVHNLFDYVQQERHPDDAAFVFAPITGRVIYGGMRVRL